MWSRKRNDKERTRETAIRAKRDLHEWISLADSRYMPNRERNWSSSGSQSMATERGRGKEDDVGLRDFPGGRGGRITKETS
jgi:hypothetical protein